MKKVNIGLEIEKMINYQGISRAEFGRRCDIAQPNVKRILERGCINTDKLVRVSEALDYNFFRLWVDDEPTTIKAESSAVRVGSGNVTLYNNTQATALGDTTNELERLRSENEMLKRTVADKQMIIDLLINKNK